MVPCPRASWQRDAADVAAPLSRGPLLAPEAGRCGGGWPAIQRASSFARRPRSTGLPDSISSEVAVTQLGGKCPLAGAVDADSDHDGASYPRAGLSQTPPSFTLDREIVGPARECGRHSQAASMASMAARQPIMVACASGESPGSSSSTLIRTDERAAFIAFPAAAPPIDIPPTRPPVYRGSAGRELYCHAVEDVDALASRRSGPLGNQSRSVRGRCI